MVRHLEEAEGPHEGDGGDRLRGKSGGGRGEQPRYGSAYPASRYCKQDTTPSNIAPSIQARHAHDRLRVSPHRPPPSLKMPSHPTHPTLEPSTIFVHAKTRRTTGQPRYQGYPLLHY